MASEREANRARDEHSDFLRRLGAHSVAVYEIEARGHKGFAVIAFFARKPEGPLPESLEITSGKRKLAVPLVAQVMKPPAPE